MRDGVCHGSVVGDVGAMADRAGWRVGWVEVDDRDNCAAIERSGRNSAPDAGRASGDQESESVEFGCHGASCSDASSV